MARILRIALLAIAFGVGTGNSQGRAGNTSTYTDIGLEKCAQEKTPPINPVHTGTWNCPGYGNIRVQLMEFDLRILVFFQIGKELLPANGETVPGFNTLGSERLEWRLNQDKKPIAAITRFNTDDDSVFVITKIGGPTEICRIGSVSEKSAVDANEEARKVADDVAPKFRCGQDKALE